MAVYDTIDSAQTAEALILKYFPAAGEGIHGATIKDFAEIAFFLESKELVRKELLVLEGLLRQRYDGGKGYTGAFDPLKAKKLLTSVLDEWDQQFHFNSLANHVELTDPLDFAKEGIKAEKRLGNLLPTAVGPVGQGNLPTGSVPTLTGFVDPQLFRRALLRLGYHWKDPGAGEVHGDMTHRLQWFAITSAAANNRLKLGVAPIYLFQKLSNPALWNPKFTGKQGTKAVGRALWDFLCDCFVEPLQPDGDGVGPYSSLGSYRSPVVLQHELTKAPISMKLDQRKKEELLKLYGTAADQLALVPDIDLLRMIIGKRTLKMGDKMANLPSWSTMPKNSVTVSGTPTVQGATGEIRWKGKGN